jgi:tetratricopeptide (TPR) repeat protein
MRTADELEVALDYFNNLVHQNPQDATALTNLAWGYERAGDYDQAIDHFKQALELEPDNIDTNYGLGLALMGSNQPEQAINAFKRAAELAQHSNDHALLVTVLRQVEAHSDRIQPS